MEVNRGDSWISLYTTDTLLRYKSEWDPRLHAHTKGGYLDGEIRVPKVTPHEMLFMTLETFPAEDVHPAVAGVHPCMLHLVRMGNGKRHSWLEPVPTKIHWKQTFEINGDKVSVINTTSELDVEKDGVTKRKVPEKDEVTQMQNNTILLGSSKGNLNLVFLKPKQSNCDATITKVLSDRLGVTDEKKLEQYKKHFVGKEGGLNMTKIRVKVSFFNAAGTLVCSSISPQTVIDNGNKKIGCMEMYDCWPRKSSPNGGRKIMMISEYDLADDVVPRFELYGADGCHRVDAEEWLVQPITSASTMAIKNHTIVFLTPAQPHLEKIQNQIGNFSLKLVAHRQGDGMTSKAFAFEYTTSCDHRMDGDEGAKIEGQDRAKPGCKKRNLKRATLQVPIVKKARTGSDGYDAPSPGASSGYNTSSPVYESPNYPDLLTLTKSEVQEHTIPLPPDIEILFTGNPECTEDEVREVLNWKREDSHESWGSDVFKTQEQTFDQMSDSSHNGNSEDDLMDILNIPKDHLLDQNSPERLDDLPQEQQDSEEEPQMDTLNTPLIMETNPWGQSAAQVVTSYQSVTLEPRTNGLIQTDAMTKPKPFKDEDFQPSTGSPEDGLRSRHANANHRVQKKTTNIPETVESSASRTDLAQILMVFTVFFILLLCVVQISSNSLGLPLTTLPLIGITSVLSLGIVGAKFARV